MLNTALFWSRVEFTADCWLWTAAKDSSGYGQMWDGSRLVTAHRLAYLEEFGSVPDGLELDHLCRNRACVRPSHLEAVTHAENMARANTITQVNAAKTYCDNGHPYDEANTYIRPNGHRDCRSCIRVRVRRYQSKAVA